MPRGLSHTMAVNNSEQIAVDIKERSQLVNLSAYIIIHEVKS